MLLYLTFLQSDRISTDVAMKIAFFTDSYIPQKNGVTTAVQTLKNSLEKKGHSVIVIAPKYPGYNSTKSIIRLPAFTIEKGSNTRFALYYPAKAMRDALLIDCDIIHGHSGGPISLLGLEVARRKKIPYIFTYHTLWSSYMHYFFKGKILTPKMVEQASKIFANMTSAIIAPSQSMKEKLISYGVTKPIDVIPNGIDTSLFQGKKMDFLREKYAISHDKHILLCVGRLGKEKSIDFVIKAFAVVHRQKPDTVLILIGEGSDSDVLNKLCNKLEIKDSVIFAGNLSYQQTIDAYKSSDLFIFASKTETQGLVVVEALAAGLPVVTVNVSPFKEILTDGESAILRPFDVKEFSKGILNLLDNEVLKEKLSKNGRLVAEGLSITKLSSKFEKLYQKVLTEPKKNRIEGKTKLLSYLKLKFKVMWSTD